jgi:hypothetical protein
MNIRSYEPGARFVSLVPPVKEPLYLDFFQATAKLDWIRL